MPRPDQMSVAVEQALAPEGWRPGKVGAKGRWQAFLQERKFVELGQFRLVERDIGADAAVGVGPHDRVYDVRLRERHEEGVVLHGGDAAAQHFDRPEQGAHVGLARRRLEDIKLGRLVEHEYLERQRVEVPFHVVDRGVEVPVDQARNKEPAAAIDDLGPGFRLEVRADCGNPLTLDEHVAGPRQARSRAGLEQVDGAEEKAHTPTSCKVRRASRRERPPVLPSR